MITIRIQIIRKLLLGLLFILGGGSLGIYFCARTALLEQFDRTLRATANAVVSGAEVQGNHLEVEIDEQYMREFHDGVPVDFFQIRSANGSTVKRSSSLATNDLPVELGTFRHPRYWDLALPSGSRGRAVGYTFSVSSTATEPGAAGP